MSTENIETPVDTVDDDLDAFTAELFGQKEAVAEKTNSKDESETETVSDAPEDETQTDEDNALETDDEDTEDEDADDAPKPKESRYQKRINELTAIAKEAERREQAILKKFEELEQKLTPPKNEVTLTPQRDGPLPDDKTEDGTEKYPLGEFDPQYIRDLTKHTLQQEVAAQKTREAAETQAKQFEAEKTALQESWSEKLAPAKERYPDFQDKGSQLFDTFAGIDAKYGEYLTATIMSLDNGPDVLYYLANNLDEANKIVGGGPTKATLALGALDARFVTSETEKPKARKVSKAPVPPTTLKGASAVSPEVADDTDDLDAFAAKLFKKK